jgi:hypothetical protein
MTRTARTLFGSFGKRLSTAVFADDWWFFHASEVELETETRRSHDLAVFLPESATKAIRYLPKRVDLAWFREVAPIGLQLQPDVIAASPLRLGLVASRVSDNRSEGVPLEDLAYPFLAVEQEDQIALQFSTSGPEPEIQRRILVAFGQRLLWQPAAEHGVAH